MGFDFRDFAAMNPIVTNRLRPMLPGRVLALIGLLLVATAASAQSLSFTSASYTFALGVRSSLMSDAVVGAVTATGGSGTIGYALINNPGGKFSVAAATGEVSYIGTTREDVTVTASYDLSVRATAGSDFVEATVTVNIGICDRTRKVWEGDKGIVSKISGVTACENVTVTELAGVTSQLNLVFKSISSLVIGDFAGLSGLEELILGLNNLSTLPEGVFAGLSRLTVLYLSHNQLIALPEGVFAGLSSLTGLYLNNNQLSALPEKVFAGLSGLTHLDLLVNRLSALPEDVFAGLSRLSFLRSYNNQLSALPEDVFAGLSLLTSLELYNNQLSVLPEDVFAGLSLLTSLELYNNQLSALPEDVFAGLSLLTSLELYNNPLSTLPEGVFADLSRLVTLYLHNSQLSTLPKNLFAGLTSLNVVNATNHIGPDFPVELSPERVDATTFRVRRDFPGPISSVIWRASGTGVTEMTGTVMIAAGTTASTTFTLPLGYTTVALTGSNLGAGFTGFAAILASALVIDAPQFGQLGVYTFDLPENLSGTAIPVIIGTVSAIDSNGDTVTYGITDASRFHVDADSGELSYVGAGEDFESTPRYTLTVQATDNDSTALVANAQVTVNIANRNDAPLFDSAVYTFGLAENQSGSAAPLPIATVTATDPDGTAVTYSLSAGDDARFRLGAANGVLSYIGSGEDFEGTTTSYTLTVQASDSASTALVATAEVTVNIADRNDNLPVFSQFAYTFPLAENQSGSDAAVVIGTVAATNTEGDAVTYTLSAGDSRRFSLAAGNGVLSYIGSGEDFEGTTTRYTLTVQATDSNSTALVATAEVSVAIANRNDKAPVFDPTAYFFTLTGNQSGAITPVVIGSVAATDPEADAVTYSLSAGGGSVRFSLGATSGELSYIGSGESAATLSLTAVASDGTLSNTVAIAVAVVNDPPQFSATGSFFLTATNRASLGTVMATDANNDPITYSLIDNFGDRFSVATDSGVISYVGSGREDVTVTASYDLSVRATAGSDFTEATVTVNIGICDRTEAVRDGIVLRIAGVTACENVTVTALGEVTGTLNLSSQTITSLVAVDFAGLDNIGILRLSENQLSSLPSGVFADLSRLTTLSLFENDLSALPEEVFRNLGNLIALSLRDNQLSSLPSGVFTGLSRLDKLYLSENDLSSLPSGVFSDLSRLTTLSLIENDLSALPEEVFSSLGSLTTLSLNNNQLSSLSDNIFAGLTSLTKLNVSANSGAPFTVELSPGQVDATSDGFLVRSDFPGPAYSSVGWEASGSGVTGTRSGTVIIAAGTTASTTFNLPLGYTTVALTGSTFAANFEGFTTAISLALTINHPPVFAPVAYTFELAENQPGTLTAHLLGTVTATDADNTSVSYSLLVGTGSVRFSLDDANGVLGYIDTGEDYEARSDAYTLTVQATDSDSTALVVTAEVTVTIADRNDAPLFAPAAYFFTLVENQPGTPTAHLLGTVTTTDADGNTVSYGLSAGDTTLFSLGVTSGVLSYIGSGEDFESTTTRYTLTVQAIDGASTALVATAQVTVNIANRNDNLPAFVDVPYSFTLAENQSGTVAAVVIGTVMATDSDGIDPTYTMSAGDPTRFSLAVSDGVLSYIGSGEDFESTTTRYTLTVRATDGASTALVATAQVTVNIANRNDNLPAFGDAPYSFTLAENQSGTVAAVVIGTVEATDSDGIDPTYTLSAGDLTRFSLAASDGALSYIGSGEDFESATTRYTLTVQAIDSASTALVATAQVTVNIANRNDNLPAFGDAPYSFTLAENQSGTVAAVVIGTVEATDSDGIDPTYTLSAGDLTRFSLAASDGALSYIGSGEDFESATTRYTLTVQAIDSASTALVATAQVTVNIANRNDNLPAFGDAPYTFELAENQSGTVAAVVIGTVTATDSDGIDPTYTLSAGDLTRFSLAASDGALSYIGSGEDFESTTTRYTLTVQAIDGASTALVATAQVTVNIANRNDNLPAFGDAPYSFTLAENQPGSAAPLPIGTVTATDSDNINPTYTLSAGDLTRFSLAVSDGVLSYIGSGEDFESATTRYTLTVQATDGASTALVATAQVTVNIANRNDNLPAFVDAPYTFGLAENQSGTVAAVVIGTVMATDSDGIDPTYTLSAGDPTRFSLAVSDGVLSYIGSGEDFESTTTRYTLTVRATDGASTALVATAQVTVTIANRNDNLPLFVDAPYTFGLAENQSGTVAAVVIGTVEATDSDGIDPTYTLSAGDLTRFSLAASDGVLSYIGSGEDFESTTTRYTLTVQAIDGASTALVATVQVTVNIANRNDNLPAFGDAPYTFELAENQSGTVAAVVIGTVMATDPDGNTATYALSAGGDARFSLAVSDGVLSYIGSGEDFESTTTRYTLTVQAIDGASTALVATAQVTVNIANRNDNLPTFVDAPYSFTLAENQSGTVAAVVIGTVMATDPDGNTATYALSAGATTHFSLGATSGVLSYIGSGEDFESTTTSYTLTVQAIDGASTALMATAQVTVNIANRNDNLPTFVDAPYSFTLAENQSGTVAAVIIGSVRATDADGDAVTYAFGTGTTLFSLDATSGQVSYIGSGEDFESTPNSYTLNIIAASGALTVSAQVTVTVTDVDETVVVRRRTQMTSMVLAQVSRNIAIDTVDVLGGRFAAAPHVTISGRSLNASQWSGLTRWMQGDYWQGVGAWNGVEREIGWDDIDLGAQWKQFEDRLLSGTSFLVSLGAAEGEASAGLERWSLWGQGRVSGYRHIDGDMKVSGRVLSGYLGVDYQASEQLLFGVAVSHSRSDGYSEMEADSSNRIDIDTEIAGVYPYLQWSSGSGFEFWGTIGRGEGEVEVKESDKDLIVADLELMAVGLGFSQRLVTVGDAEITVKADGFLVQMQSDGVAALNATDSKSHRLRAALAGGQSWSLGGNARVFGGMELGARLDGGDGVGGQGLDIGANFGYVNPDIGLEAHSRVRFLVAHSEEYSDWGLDVTVRLQPSGWLGRGLSLSVAPGWGQSATAIDSLWKGGVSALKPAAGAGRGFIPDRTRFSLRYGLHYRGALWSPFAEAGMDRESLSALKLGLRVDLSRLRVEAFGNQDQTIGIEGRFSF